MDVDIWSDIGTTRERALAMLAQMTETAAADGLEFHFERARSGNTFDGHRLLHLALEHGRLDAMKERLMRAYLTEGELISDHEALRRLALEAGLPEEPVDELLGGACADHGRGRRRALRRRGLLKSSSGCSGPRRLRGSGGPFC